MKAANIYQQFDKKGNLFENRLYAKTSINQAKLGREQETYDKRMQSYPEEMCRINNGSFSINSDMGVTPMGAYAAGAAQADASLT